MDKKENMKLWDSVFKTDLKYTKPANKDGYDFTSIAPMYQKKRATEAMGPQGIGWGIEIDSETFEYKEISTTTFIVYRAVMFFEFEGKRGRIPICAMEKLSYMTRGYKGSKGYLKIDGEADKKVKTSALTKGLSEIGVSADIHMNLHTNHEYSELVKAEIRIEEGDSTALDDEKNKFKEWLDNQIKAINLCPNAHAIDIVLNRIWQTMQDKLTVLRSDQNTRHAFENKLRNSAEKAKQNLINKEGK